MTHGWHRGPGKLCPVLRGVACDLGSVLGEIQDPEALSFLPCRLNTSCPW
jgi:hypothetical protein